MDNMIGDKLEQDRDKVSIPDLDWTALDKDNIPTENNVEAIPQLQDAWTHKREKGTNLIENKAAAILPIAESISQEEISGVIKQAKREMMLGLKGKKLAGKMASLFTPEVIAAAKDDLIKLAEEQGLLGNVYIDLTPFESCHEAAQILGKNRIRTARYVTGNPSRKMCASHKNGFCRELNKKVLASMEYSDEVLKTYTDHLRIAGIITAGEAITSKDLLREAFLKSPESEKPINKEASVTPQVDVGKLHTDLAEQISKSASDQEKEANNQRFYAVRPILAHMQNLMLKGKTGNALKEGLRTKFSFDEINQYADEISKVANLQGIMGNVYVDVSYYKSPEEAISAIKTASTNPFYLVQTHKENDFDSTIVRVAKATGCTEFPKNGTIDKRVAFSYIDDLQYSERLASGIAETLRKKVVEGGSILSVIRDAFVASQQHKSSVREGGVKVHFAQGTSKKASNRETLKQHVVRAIEAGISVDKIEDKLASLIATPEAMGLIRDVLAGAKEVDANCLTNCTIEKYQLRHDATLKVASKCGSCILKSGSVCMKQSIRFSGSKDLTKPYFDLDINTEKVQLDENPDLERGDMKQEYDIDDDSGMNISIDNIREKDALEIDLGSSLDGLDNNIL